jgi:hypothetical protein
MAKLNLNVPVVDETGSILNPEKTLGQTLAFVMVKSINKVETDIIKFYDWAQKLGENKPLEIDEADSKKLKDFVINNEDMYLVVKAPIIKAIDKLKF